MDSRRHILLSFRCLISRPYGHSLMSLILSWRPTQNCPFDLTISLIIFGFMCMDDSLWILSEVGSIKNKINLIFFLFAIKGSKNLNGEVLSVHPKARIQQGTQFLDFQFFFWKGWKILPNENGNANKFKKLWNVLSKRMLMMFGSTINDNRIKEQWNLLIWHLNLGNQMIN